MSEIYLMSKIIITLTSRLCSTPAVAVVVSDYDEKKWDLLLLQ